MKKRSNTLPIGVKIGYAAPQFAEFAFYNAFVAYSMFFFTDVVHLPIVFVGIITAVGTLWDAITDPLVGMWSDNRDPKKGRRRWFLLWNSVIFGLVFWLMFTDWGFPRNINMIYFAIMILAYKTTHTILDIPYTSLGAEMTQDYDERSSLNSFRNFFGSAGNLVNSFLWFPLIMLFSNERLGWSMVALGYGILSTLFILWGWRATKGMEMTTDSILSAEKVGYKDYFEVLKNKSFRYITGMFSMSIVAQSFVNATAVYYMINVLGLDEIGLSIMFGAIWVSSMIIVPILNWIAIKTSKKTVWNFTMIIWVISILLFPLYLLKPGSGLINFWTSLGYMIFFSVGVTGQYQFSWAMIPDSIEVDEFNTGKRREGIFYACMTFIQKAATAAAILLVGYLIKFTGYDPNAVTQTFGTVMNINSVHAYSTLVALIITVGIGMFYPITPKNYNALLEALEAKKTGQNYSIDGFRELLSKEDIEREEEVTKIA